MKKKLLILLISYTNFAQTLDTSFDGDGILKFQNSNTASTHTLYDAAQQPDGKTVYIGAFNFPSEGSFIARYNIDGSKDNTFNQYGFNTIREKNFRTLTIQNDGKLVVAGKQNVYRFLANGELDTSFNGSGSLEILVSTQTKNITCVSVQPDNKIIVSGYIYNGTNNDFFIARINNDGTLDSTFDTDGIQNFPMGPGFDQSYSHKIQPDGKIVLFGIANNGTDNDFALARINTDGSLDTTFGVGGKVLTPFVTSPASTDFAKDGYIMPDGTILVFGSSSNKFAFARYTPSGNLDTTFNTTGKVTLNHTFTTSNPNNFAKLRVLSDGKILVSGTSNNNYKVIRLLADQSTYDTSFDTDGVVEIDDNDDLSCFLFERPDGKIVTGGYTIDTNTNESRIKENILNNNGSLYSNSIKNLYLSYDSNTSSILYNDGSYLTLSLSFVNNQINVRLKKILANGAVDTQFGFSGNLAVGSSFNSNYLSPKILKLPNDKLIVSFGRLLYGYNADGSIDNTFGPWGIADLSSYITNPSSSVSEIILTNDNKILVGFPYDNGTGSSVGILRLNLDGSIDNTFGTNGSVTYRFHINDTSFTEWPTSICTDSNNNILVTGISTNSYTTYALNRSVSVLKLNQTGSLDTTFGTNGLYITEESFLTWPDKIMATPDNNYLISCSNYESLDESRTIKIKTNGQIDTMFGNNGIAVDLPSSYNEAMITQPDGKILKAGSKNNQFSISRYNTDGSLDNGFGTNGEISTSIDLKSRISNMLLQTDGKLLVTGVSFDGDRQVITLARYTGLNLGTLDFSTEKNTLLVYPNPIEKEATFQYSLINNENVSIDIVDVQGRMIKKICTNQSQNAGEQTLHFDLDATVASGNYFLRIATAKSSQSVQLIKK